MIYTFEYKDTTYKTEDIQKLEQYVLEWIEDHWNDFVEYGNNKHGATTKENFDDVLESFYEDTVTEE
jgi:hypothetical protein